VRLLFVTHYFHPEVGAPQTRIFEAARGLRARGHEVTVLTGLPNYPDGIVQEPYRGRLLMTEDLDGIRVVRCAVYPAANRGFGRRLANHASFAAASLPAAGRARPADVVVVESPPLFTAVAGVGIARGLRAPLVLNVADLWPESAVQLGVLRGASAIRLAEALERFAYRHAAAITVPTPGMRTILLARGIAPERVTYLPNAVDVRRFAGAPPPPHTGTRLVYCGTVGMAQGVGTIIEAVALLAEMGERYELDIVGDGAEREGLERLVRQRGLAGVRFRGRLPADAVPAVVARADIALMSLRDVPLFEDAVPTKVLEYMAAGRPVVAAARGQVARLVDEVGAGVACPPEYPAALAAAIRRVAADRPRAHQMGENGRRYVIAERSRDAMVQRLEAVAAGVLAGGDERARVRAVYDAYAASPRRRRAWSAANAGNRRILAELEEAVAADLTRAGRFPGNGRILLDVGCGSGELLAALVRRGAPPDALRGVDLLEERIAAARARVPGADVRVADARELPGGAASVDAVILSVVLSSIPDGAVRAQVAREALRVLRRDGVLLCYDARMPNPANRRIRAIGRAELGRLFAGCSISSRTLTVLPPLARRLGPATAAGYGVLHRVAPLRTHRISVIRPRQR
jgi:glycosyltransferase involved in cell wall biosynthesis/SAM-dependent methyltransferase